MMKEPESRIILYLLAFIFTLTRCPLPVVRAASQNRTIDDTYGDPIGRVFPVYGPNADTGPGLNDGAWNAQPGCQTCLLKADPAQAFNNTWHDNEYYSRTPRMSVSITFSGSAIYIFNILPSGQQDGYITNITFYLDGLLDHAFFLTPTPSDPDFLYNYNVYSRQVPNGTHTVNMTIPDTAASYTVLLFDYAVYTYESPDETSSFTVVTSSSTTTLATTKSTINASVATSSPTTESMSARHDGGFYAGIIIGALAGITLLALLFFWLIRRHRSQTKRPGVGGLASESSTDDAPMSSNTAPLNSNTMFGDAYPGQLPNPYNSEPSPASGDHLQYSAFTPDVLNQAQSVLEMQTSLLEKSMSTHGRSSTAAGAELLYAGSEVSRALPGPGTSSLAGDTALDSASVRAMHPRAMGERLSQMPPEDTLELPPSYIDNLKE